MACGVVLGVSITGCGTSASETSSGGSESSDGVPTIVFSTGGALPPNEMEQAIYAEPLRTKGVLRNFGKKYKLKMISVKGTPEAQNLLVSGQADLAVLAFSTIATGEARKAFPKGISIIAGEFQDGHAGYGSNPYMALKKSGIRSAEDLRGKTLGVNAVGTAVDILMRVWLKDHGLDPEKDVKFAEIPFPAMGAALRSGRIALGSFVQPFTAVEKAKNDVRPLFTAKDAVGENAAIVVVGRNDYLKANGDAVRAFLEDWVAGLDWLQDPKNRDEAIDIMSEITGTPAKSLKLFYGKGEDYYRDPSACPNARSLQVGVDAMVKTGYLPSKVDVAKLVDTSYLPRPCG